VATAVDPQLVLVQIAGYQLAHGWIVVDHENVRLLRSAGHRVREQHKLARTAADA